MMRDELRGGEMRVVCGLIERLTGELQVMRVVVGCVGEAGISCEVREWEELCRISQRVAGDGVKWRLFQGRRRVVSIRDVDMGVGNVLTVVVE
jgi:hypothetical protein